MLNQAYLSLDQTELVQLALNAGAKNDDAAAIAYLKEAVSRADATATAHYLLGAQYAQAGLYERSVDAMEAAIALDPALSVARLQLGLLWASTGAADRARVVLEPLQDLAEDDCFRLFGAGLRRLLDDDLDEAIELLRAGIARNEANEPLNADVRQVLAAAEQTRAALPGTAPTATAPTESEEHVAAEEIGDGRHVLLSAYMGNAEADRDVSTGRE